MLYEVITGRHDDAVVVGVPATAVHIVEAVIVERELQVVRPEFDEGGIRITSYNVCYTKLLRCLFPMHRNGRKGLLPI